MPSKYALNVDHEQNITRLSPANWRRAVLNSGLGVAAIVLAGCGGGYNAPSTTAATNAYTPAPAPAVVSTINNLGSIKQVASAVGANGDANPYGIAIAPSSFNGLNADGSKSVLQPGDLILTDFSDKTGANVGTSILRYSPSTASISPFYTEHVGTGPVAVAISSKGASWIANFQPGYTNSADGTTTGDGNVVVITPNGTDIPNNMGIIDNNSGATFNPAVNKYAGPWGQAFGVKAGSTTPHFFVSNVDSGHGWVQREDFTAPNFNKATVTTIALEATGTNAFDPTGPQGMVYDPKTDILYVASTADNKIWAIPNATTAAPSTSPGILVYANPQNGATPLNGPVGMTINPINGDLIVADQLDNNLVEIAPNATLGANGYTFSATLVGTKLVDNTAVNATAGTGSALFDIVANTDASGNLEVYYVDSVTNTLNLLSH